MTYSILIVDDRAINRKFLTMLLSFANYRVLEAADGAEALDVVRAERPALVISDVLMPTMDGLEFANRLRAEPAIAHIPLIFYTATYRLSEAWQLAHACGAAMVLAKPAEPQVILDAVAKVLGRNPGVTVPVVPEDGVFALQEAKLTSRFPELIGFQQHLQKAFHESLAPADLTDGSHSELPYPQPTPNSVYALGLRLAALLEVHMVLSLERDQQKLLDLFCRAVQDIVTVKSVAVGMLIDDEPRRYAGRGVADREIRAIFDAFDPHQGRLHQALLAGQMIRSEDIVDSLGVLKLEPLHPLLRSCLIVPVVLGTQAYGWLYLAGKLGNDHFNQEDEQFAATLVAQLAPAYENLILYDQVRARAGQLEIEMTRRKQIADALLERETGLRRAQLLSRLAHVITGPHGDFESWSDTLPLLLGVEAGGMPASTREWLDYVHPTDRDTFRNCCIDAGKSGARKELEYRLRHTGGNYIQVWQVLEPLLGEPTADGKGRWFNTIQDISEQKEQSEKIARLSRVHAVMSGINSAIVRIHDRDELLREACRVAVNQGAFSMAWIGVVDPLTLDGEVLAWSGCEPEHLKKFRLTGCASETGSNFPACVAVREQRPVIFNDIGAQAAVAPFALNGQDRGGQSVAALPLMVADQVVAVIVLLADESGFFDEQEVKLLSELAGDLSFGLQSIAKEERLNYLAYYDVLTGLPNGMLFEDRLAQFLLGGKTKQDKVCCIVINLDHFAQLNDAMGRATGDALLRQIALRLRTVLKEPFSLARAGSDSFLLAIADLVHAADAALILEQDIFAPLGRPFILDQQEIRITLKAGIAVYPEDGADAETLVKHAEVALKKARSSGERFLYYAPQMNAAIAARLTLENALRLALEERQFVLHYQPRVDLLSGRIVGAEALIRWKDPRRGMVSPLDFIPLAEETGQIIPIGAWVIDTVCAQQAAWLAQQINPVPVAINLSAVQFKKSQVLQTIGDALERHRLEQKHLEFELTESVVMENPEQAARVLRAMKSMGLKLSLDDFGTGYSSLAYLKRFPFDFVKIDRAFVTDITNSTEDAAIAIAVIAMAHSLGLRVVAEGVETEGQLRFLRKQRCDEIQGYYFSPPVPVEAFESMLREDRRLVLQRDPTEKVNTLLLVDDEPGILAALKRLLRLDGYRVLTASGGQEALDLLALNRVQVIVTDQRMPGMSGSEFLAVAKELYPDTIRLILSGYTDLQTLTDSINRGAIYKFLTKPWNDEALREQIHEAFRRYR